MTASADTAVGKPLAAETTMVALSKSGSSRDMGDSCFASPQDFGAGGGNH